MNAHKTTWLLLLASWMSLSGCSSTRNFRPAPGSSGSRSLTSISPANVLVGSPDLTLSITGTNFAGARHFFSQAVLSVNGSNTLLATTFIDSTQLTAIVPAPLLNSPISAQVFVQTGDPMGDIALAKSNSLGFSVTTSPANPGAPLITSMTPNSAGVGSPDLTLSITGAHFANSVRYYHSVVTWSVNGTDIYLATSIASSTQLTAVIPAALLVSPGKAAVSVQTWYFADDIPTSVSSPVAFTVN